MAKLFLDVLNLSITASWLIAAVMLVRLVIRQRAPKWLSCLLWAMVGIRLILPFSLESAVSLVPSRETIIPESVYGETVLQTPDVTPPENEDTDTPVQDTDTPPADTDVPNDVPNTDAPDHFAPPENLYVPDEFIHSGISAIDDRVNPIIQSTAKVENGESKNALQTVTFWASCIWMIGMAVLILNAVINYLLLKKRLATSIPEGKDIRKSEAVGSPFILGLFRPRIYMPFGLTKTTEEHVLAHERAHLKRGDHLIKPIGYAILTVHWFNPLVWLGYILLCRDIEYACDEKVVKNMSAEARKAYAEALLECGVSKSRISACPIAFGETGVKKRVKNTLNYKKPLFWVMIAAIIICAAVAVFFLTSPAAKDKETSDVSDIVDVSEVSDVIDESDVSKTEESKPEESKPEESKPELTQEEIKEKFRNYLSALKEKQEPGYREEYNGTTIRYCSADNSTYVEENNFEYNYYNNGIYAYIPDNDVSIALFIEKADYETFVKWTGDTITRTRENGNELIRTLLETDSEITFIELPQAEQYVTTAKYVHDEKYEGTVKINAIAREREITIVAQYNYKEVYNGKTTPKTFTKEYTLGLHSNPAKPILYSKADKTYNFKDLKEYEDYCNRIYEFYSSVYNLGENSLNKAIYVNYEGVDSRGSNGYLNEKTVAVGANDDYVVAKLQEYYKPSGEIYKSDTYSYITEKGYDSRRIWEGYNFHNIDLPYGSVIKHDEVDSKEQELLFSDRSVQVYRDDTFFTDYLKNGGKLSTDLHCFKRIVCAFDKIEYTSNDDGTITVNFTCSGRQHILSLLFGTTYQINGHWISERNVYDHVATLTYDPETGMMTSLSVDCTATRDGFWYKHEFDLTVTDADESMLPIKVELLAGSW